MDDLEINMEPRMNFNFWPSCLHLQSAEFTGMHHHAQPGHIRIQTQDCVCARQALYQLSHILVFYLF